MAAQRSSTQKPGQRGGSSHQKNKKTAKHRSTVAVTVLPFVTVFAALFLLVVQLFVEWTGVVGAFLRELGLGLLGGGFYILVPLMLLSVVFWRRDVEHHAVGMKTVFALILVCFTSALAHIICMGNIGLGDYTVQQLYQHGIDSTAGGAVGGILASLLLNCGIAGAVIISVAVLLLFGMFYCGTTPMKVVGDLRYRILSRRERREQALEELEKQQKNLEKSAGGAAAVPDRETEMQKMQQNHDRRRRERKEEKRRARIDHNVYSDADAETPGTPDAPAEASATERLTPEPVADEPLNRWNLNEILGIKKDEAPTVAGQEAGSEKSGKSDAVDAATDATKAGKAGAGGEELPVQVSALDAKTKKKADGASGSNGTNGSNGENGAKQTPAYQFPPIAYLQRDLGQMNIDVTAELQENAEKLVSTLQSFRVNTKIIHVSRGPTITRYELAPEAGTRVRSISNLVDDIALSLATTGVRIESPIPGKAAVGIEVPNKAVATVYVRDLMENDTFRTADSRLTTCLGMDVAGAPVYLDIAKMPHLLIAGATGMGKSVCINSLIVSILYKATPDEVKLILIDPKKVELNVYNGIPHLLVPVVSDPKKAAGSLHWAVVEMEKRFEMIESVGVRDIKAYNQITADDPEREHMSQIVIIIDELADLMMTAPVEVEESICRLAQKARAAGMHLIIGTQRPSVDVITGLIKANIPSRIAFTVASQVDSRTILDIAGAEKLIGRGDMLYAPVGITKPVRVQGSFVSEKEIEKITDFLKKNAGEVEYDQSVVELIARAAELCGSKKGKAAAPVGAEAVEGELNGDPKLKEAIDLAVQNGTISTSLLQRRLSLGYGRAAKILDAMQEKGIVSPPEGQKPRNVLISRAQWEELQMNRDVKDTDAALPHKTDASDQTSDSDEDFGSDSDAEEGEALPWED